MKKTTHPSSSNEQKDAEKELIHSIAKDNNWKLEKCCPLEEEPSLQVDGYCKEPPIICEAWAHCGKPKSGQ